MPQLLPGLAPIRQSGHTGDFLRRAKAHAGPIAPLIVQGTRETRSIPNKTQDERRTTNKFIPRLDRLSANSHCQSTKFRLRLSRLIPQPHLHFTTHTCFFPSFLSLFSLSITSYRAPLQQTITSTSISERRPPPLPRGLESTNFQLYQMILH